MSKTEILFKVVFLEYWARTKEGGKSRKKENKLNNTINFLSQRQFISCNSGSNDWLEYENYSSSS